MRLDKNQPDPPRTWGDIGITALAIILFMFQYYEFVIQYQFGFLWNERVNFLMMISLCTQGSVQIILVNNLIAYNLDITMLLILQSDFYKTWIHPKGFCKILLSNF